MPELHSFRLRGLSHVLYHRSLLSHDFAQRPLYVRNLRHAFPVREMWSPAKSFNAEKSLVPFGDLGCCHGIMQFRGRLGERAAALSCVWR